MSAPIYAVNRVCRSSRRVLDTHAEGVTLAEAREIARLLRADDEANEALWGYQITTLPIARQAEILGLNGDGEAAEIEAEVRSSSVAPTEPRHGRMVESAGDDQPQDAPRVTPPAASPVGRAAALVEAVLRMPSRYARAVEALADDRARDAERDHNLRVALRNWADEALGSVDALAMEMARRYGCTSAHARNAIYSSKSAPLLDVAVAIVREHAAEQRAAVGEAAVGEAAGEVAAAGGRGALRLLPQAELFVPASARECSVEGRLAA